MIEAKEMRKQVLDIPQVIQIRIYEAAKNAKYSAVVRGRWSDSVIRELRELGYTAHISRPDLTDPSWRGDMGELDSITIGWEE